MSAPQVFVGIDVAKAQLDIALRPTGERPADAGMQRAVWAAEGGGTRRSNAPGVRGTLQSPHDDNTARSPGEGDAPQGAWTRQPTRRWQSHGETMRMNQPARRCLLAVFAHPDDETSAAAGTLIHYARAGVDI